MRLPHILERFSDADSGVREIALAMRSRAALMSSRETASVGAEAAIERDGAYTGPISGRASGFPDGIRGQPRDFPRAPPGTVPAPPGFVPKQRRESCSVVSPRKKPARPRPNTC